MKVKKVFVELVAFLEANQNKKVSSILDDIKKMTMSKKIDSTILKNAKGEVVAIFCYYHKQWELISDVDYGAKKNTASGYNTMCKIGVSKWTKQQRNAKNSSQELLKNVSEGKVDHTKLLKLQADIEAIRLKIDTTNMPKGTDTEPTIPGSKDLK